MRGRNVGRLVAVFDVLCYAVRKDALVRLVVVRDPAGTELDDFLVTTDLSAGSADIASRDAGRWPIECCFREAKQHAGVEHPQSWTDQGPAHAVMLAFWLHTAIWCAATSPAGTTHPPGGPAPGTPQEDPTLPRRPHRTAPDCAPDCESSLG